MIDVKKFRESKGKGNDKSDKMNRKDESNKNY